MKMIETLGGLTNRKATVKRLKKWKGKGGASHIEHSKMGEEATKQKEKEGPDRNQRRVQKKNPKPKKKTRPVDFSVDTNGEIVPKKEKEGSELQMPLDRPNRGHSASRCGEKAEKKLKKGKGVIFVPVASKKGK